MNIEQLKEALQIYYDNYNEIDVAVYVILKNQEVIEPKKLDIEAESLSGLKEIFIQSLRDTITDKEDLTLLNLSASDERTNTIYTYDLDIPDELTTMQTVTEADNLPLFNADEDQLSNIKALLIEIGNHIGQTVLYKSMAPVNIFKRSSFFLKKTAHRFEKINDEFLRISAGFQLLRINGELLVIDLSSVERAFGFYEVIMREANIGLNSIEKMNLVQNPETLRELLDDVKYARRFTKIAKSSPVISAGVSNDSIITFCKKFPQLAGKIRFNDTEDQIMLDTKVSKDLFIKLLMDDFLTSELTQHHYTSVAKDSADDTPEE